MCPRAKTKTKVKSAKWKIKQQQQQQNQQNTKSQNNSEAPPGFKIGIKTHEMRWDGMIWGFRSTHAPKAGESHGSWGKANGWLSMACTGMEPKRIWEHRMCHKMAHTHTHTKANSGHFSFGLERISYLGSRCLCIWPKKSKWFLTNFINIRGP